MMPVSAMLTSTGVGLEQFYPYIPMAVAAVCAVILLIAFCVGLKKGARRVSWGGFVWLFAGGLFILLDKYAFVEGNPLNAPLESIAASFGLSGAQATEVGAFGGAFVLALGCILIALVLYGICSLLFRPKIKRIKKDADIYTIDEEGIEYDEEYYDYDDYEEYQSRTTFRRKGYGTPSVFGRLAGGLICAVNAAMVLAVVVCVALFALDTTSLKETALGAVYQAPIVQTLVDIAANYALDMAFIGVIISFACKGQRRGFLETLRSLLATFGGLLGTVVSFYLPFSPMAQSGFIGEYVSRCISAANSLFGASIPQFAPMIGQIFAGLILCVVILILLALFNLLLRKLVEVVENNGFLRAVDGSVACLIYLVVGVVVVALIWAVWFVLSYYGIFKAELLFTADSSLSSGMFHTMDAFLSPMLEQLGAVLAGMGA